jgi:hypothetical protein
MQNAECRMQIEEEHAGAQTRKCARKADSCALVTCTLVLYLSSAPSGCSTVSPLRHERNRGYLTGIE